MQKKEKTLTFFNLVASFFKIGLTAFGMAILQQIKALIIQNKWLTKKEVDEGIAMVQLYPGPIMYNLGIYCSYKLKGFWGSLFASFFFLLPSYLLMVFFSWIYFSYGTVDWVKPMFLALEAMVVGIVFKVFLEFGQRYVKNIKSAIIAATAFILLLYKINALIIIGIAVVLEVFLNFFIKDEKEQEKSAEKEKIQQIPGKFSHRMIAIVVTGFVFLSMFAIGFFVHTKNGELLFSMFKIGSVAFGSGFTIMPLLQQEAVVSHHWVTMKQFADGIAFGQITPGPFLITSTFIGYKISGIWGSIIATFGMFFPSFFYTLVVSEIYAKIKNNVWIQRAIKGVMGAFTGMLAWVVLSLSEVSLKSTSLFIWAVGSFILVRYTKINIIWIFLIGILAKLALFFMVK